MASGVVPGRPAACVASTGGVVGAGAYVVGISGAGWRVSAAVAGAAGGEVPGTTCAGCGGACGPIRAGAKCEKPGAPGGWPSMAAGGIAWAPGGGSEAGD